jgi:serine protease Do
LKLNNRRFILSIVIINVLFTILLILGYHWFVNLDSNIDESLRRRVVQVAENDILFSRRFLELGKSAVPSDFIAASEISRKAVVFIKTDAKNATSQNSSPFSLTSGSGVILTNDGYIVTNYHVIKDASKIEITLNDNRVFNGKIIGSDANTDLALLKITAENIDFLTFGNSDSLQVGEWVMAVGNPFRLQSTVTAGIVSAKARNINMLESQGIESFIQTDAAVNPGNSGGALTNTRGELVGICTAIESNSGNYEGFSFAIPSNLVRKVVSDLRTYGVVQWGWLGIEVQNITDPLAKQYHLPEVSGVLVERVI